MKLYDDPIAPSARRVRVFLAEKEISVPLEPVQIMKGEHLSEGHRSRIPRGQIPVLELDDGTVITETVAISRYFEILKPDPPLFGVDGFDSVLVEMWQRRVEFELYYPAIQYFRHCNQEFASFEEQVPQWGELCRRRTEAAIRRLNEGLAGRQFIAGERYTIADITALCGLDFAGALGIEIPDDCLQLAEWHADVSGRASASS